ncbi:DUF3644 domain-containing protein [Sphingopyxis terrae subsp. ummariensis]|uniref:DUF3644 domain-containing protein n=2 Tax=Sphingopyxis terrae TaxID=33052 RepID=A0A1Y6FP25_9SPHN|nr:DUF3644 domain-containing protein [Sphingopyxis terrae subsp. ummariensis]SMQ76467.1 Protein of unknown function [Sphingopyxis terrae subsp. ummariensis]
MARRPGNKLERWEVGMVKAMLARSFVPQDIQAYFSRPTRSINHARISEIRDGAKHRTVKAASDGELDAYLHAWPDVDPDSGLSIRGDELLIKAREAMIAAVHTFNSGGLLFRAEIFIVTAIIAWTYLMHAYYRREGVDYRYRRAGLVQTTPNGAEKYWELGQCIATGACPLDHGAINNLKFLLEIRHEIEHRATNRIDDALSAKLQACCLNFNDAIKSLFGAQFALERRLPIALQFVTFDGSQRALLAGENLPAHIATAMDNFHNGLTEDEQKDPRFRYRVAFVPKVTGRATNADLAIDFVRPGSPEAAAVERVLLKEVERQKYLPSQIVTMVREAGYPHFNMFDHTKLAQQLDARNPAKGYGVLVANAWYWYEGWFEKVIEKLVEGWVRPANL